MYCDGVARMILINRLPNDVLSKSLIELPICFRFGRKIINCLWSNGDLSGVGAVHHVDKSAKSKNK